MGKIMPMGDSITLGVPINGGYRDPLYALLTNRTDTFTFVGSQTGYPTDALTAAGQTHHEGHSGYVITNGTSRSGLDENLASWIGPSALTPDKILLMIGSNDINLSYDMTNAPMRLSNLVTHIYGLLPNVKLYLASIIPMVGHESDVQTFNAAIPGIVASHRALGRNVVYVPMHDALNIGTDLNDGLHPNAQGYQRMASAWDAALHTNSTHAVDVTGAGGGAGGGSGFSVGWEFSVTQSVVVTSLGQFDPDSHPTNSTVALYLKGGAKLIEAAIPTNSTAEASGNYSARYVPVSSTVLTSGTYVVFSTQSGENFIAPSGTPAATFGAEIHWNKGVAQSAGDLPSAAPATWSIENTNSLNYFGPTFTYDVATSGPPLAVSMSFPANNRAFTAGATVAVTATVANGTSPYTVQFYRKTGNGSFAAEGSAQAGTGPAFALSLGALPAGTNQVYAVVTDSASPQLSATSATNTFFVLTGTHAVDVTSAGSGAGLGTSYSVGWDFTVTSPVTVTSLGQLDPDSNATSNTVVIYRRGGAKVVEAAVLASSPFETSGAYSSRYVPVGGVLLTNGNYVAFSTQNGENFIAPNGSPTAAFGSAITWNKGIANTNGSAYAPPPATAPATWPIENTASYRYIGPLFKYDLVPVTLSVSLIGPTNGQMFAANRTLSALVSVPSATGAYTVHIYTNGASGAFAEAGTGGSNSTYQVNLGLLAPGTYHIYATAADTLTATNTATNTFTVVAGGQQILGLTGWNKDLIIGKDEAAPGYSTNMGGWNFYEFGLTNGTLGLAADGGGTNRTFTSSRNPGIRFQFQPYTNNNALYLDGPTNLTLALASAAKFQSIQILETTRTMSWYAKLNFSDGSSTSTTSWSDPDWTANPGPSDRCLTTYGLKSASNGSFYTGYLWMAQRDVTLTQSDQNKTLTSITFVTTGASGCQLAVFAVSGYALDSLSGTNHAVELTSAGDGASGGSSYSVGWDFTVTQPIRIKALGQFDPNGTAVSNTVALYQRGGAKVAQAAVLTSSPSEYSGNYATRFAAVADVVLTNGNYVVVSTQNGDNFIAGGGNPAASFGPGVTWNKGIAMASGSAAGPLPDVAPAAWSIENTSAFRYFGPTFSYELVVPPPTITLVSPTNGQTLAAGDLLAASVTVARAVGSYTVHVYTNSGAAAFAEAGTGGSSSPYVPYLGLLPTGGTYHVYATISDVYSTTNTATNTFSVAVKIGQQYVGLTGWNQDLIIGASEAAPGYTVNMSGWNFYERGLSNSTQGLPADAAGTNRTFASSSDPKVKFQFAPYVGNNAAYFQGAGSVTLSLINPSKFYSLQLLEVARSMNWYATLNFADGTSTSTTNWSDPDWTATGPSDTCLTFYGLKSTGGSFFSSYLWMAARKITLSPADRAKTLTSITVTTTGSSSQNLAVFAASGYALGSTTNDFHAADVMTGGDGPSGGGTYSVGWDFTVSETITVTSLGQFDPDANAKTNTVALYQRAGAKLVEATVYPASASEQSGNYSARYVKSKKVVLPAGSYVIMSTQNGDNFLAGNGTVDSSFGPAITWNRGHAMASGSSAGPLPDSAANGWSVTNTAAYRFFGPTFKYELGAIYPEGTMIRIK